MNQLFTASYAVNLSSPAVIPIDIPLDDGTVDRIDVYLGADMSGGAATFNFGLNSTTGLFSGVDRWIIPDGEDHFSKTGIGQAAVRGDYLTLLLEDITGGATAVAPIMVMITYDDGTVLISDAPYNATSWNGDTAGASKNALRDKIESLVADYTAAIAAAVVGLFDLKGSTNCSANPNYPAASKGDAYVVSAAGKIGGASGLSVGVGDMYFALADNAGGTQAGVGGSWDVLEYNTIGGLLAANNLSDLASAPTARTNLGLGSLATQSGTFSGTSSGTNTGDQDLSSYVVNGTVLPSSDPHVVGQYWSNLGAVMQSAG